MTIGAKLTTGNPRALLLSRASVLALPIACGPLLRRLAFYLVWVIPCLAVVACSGEGTPHALSRISSPLSATACAPVPAEMTAWWKADGSPNDRQRGNHGNLVNGASFGPGIVGQSFVFDGIDDYVEMAETGDLDMTGDFSIEGWINLHSYSSNNYSNIPPVLGKYDYAGQNWPNTSFGVDVLGNGALDFYAICGTSASETLIGTTAAGAVPLGTWTHLAVVFQRAEPSISLYVDGARAASTSSGSCPNPVTLNDVPFRIGRRGDADAPAFLDGAVDEVSVYKRAVSASEIFSIYTAGSQGKCVAPGVNVCTSTAQCASGFCVDGVCCESACGGGDPTDCQACSVAAGGTADGTCAPLAAMTGCADDGNACTREYCDGTSIACQHAAGNAGSVCRPAAPSGCDVPEFCDGNSTACPSNGFAPVGTTCAAATNICQTAGTCGGGPTCSGPTAIPSCFSTTIPACSADCNAVSLRGGTGVENGITVEFQGGVTVGQLSVVPCGVTSPPPTGYQIAVGTQGKYCWDLETTATYPDPGWQPSAPGDSPPPIVVCIHYPQALVDSVGNESLLRMVHDSGSGFGLLPGDPFPDENIICGATNSLSPFAIVVPLDRVAPVFSNVPNAITAFATSTSGAKVTYALPKAVDAVDGARPVTCSRASGTTFPVGKTTVTCAAADKVGNQSTASFAVWVQYQAPADGSFFLSPIRANGSSIFRIGKAVPVKFKLTGASAGITNLVARLIVTKTSTAVGGTVEDVGDEDGEDTDFVFKCRPAKTIYGYRWKTRGESQGTYQLRADLGDGVSHVVDISLRAAK